MSNFQTEVSAGERFKFGENWLRFLASVDDSRIRSSVAALEKWLGPSALLGKTFLDVGSGSGLPSLAAHKLGAVVTSFDYDPQSVACTEQIRRRFGLADGGWKVLAGSALDPAFLGTLGRFDVVYSWGVLHHTGAMWQALENIAHLVKPGGQLFIAIYNDQGPWSRRWTSLKRIYNKLPGPLAAAFATVVMGATEIRKAIGAVLRLDPGSYIRSWTDYGTSYRGFTKFHDLVDWIGGYPFEVAKPEAVFDFYRTRGFSLERLGTCAGGVGCNQFVFRRNAEG